MRRSWKHNPWVPPAVSLYPNSLDPPELDPHLPQLPEPSPSIQELLGTAFPSGKRKGEVASWHTDEDFQRGFPAQKELSKALTPPGSAFILQGIHPIPRKFPPPPSVKCLYFDIHQHLQENVSSFMEKQRVIPSEITIN